MAKQKKRYKKLEDAQILAAIECHIQDSVSFKDSQLSRERLEVLDYFNGKRPKPMHNGNSKYVSYDVYDSVETMKGNLLETFAGGANIFAFDPQGPEDVKPSKIGSLYTNYVIFRQNPGYEIFSGTIDDGLKTRIGVVKCYWDEWTEEIEEDFDGITMEEMDALIAGEDVELQEYAVDEDGLVSGTLCRYKKHKQVKIDPVAPENLIFSAREKNRADPSFIGEKSVRMAGELLKMGMKQEDLDKLPAEYDDPISEQEQNARTDYLSTASNNANLKEYQDQVKPIRVYEVYLKLDVDGSGIPKLWKFLKVGEKIVDRERVDRHPFKFFVPLPVPHAFLGSNFAQKVIPIQNARTTLIRGILDHTVATNNPRTMVVKGALVNPREMLENRQGGVVNVTRPDGVLPYPQAPLNPFVYQTIGLLDADKEQNTGTSKLSQGLNRDAISNQNSEGLVENLVGLSQQRQKIVARNFALFLIELALEVYRLVLENEDRQSIVELAGEWVDIDPKTWIERKDCVCTLKLGYGEQEKEAQKWLLIHKLMSDPTLAPMYPAQMRYNVIKKALEADGKKAVDEILAAPPPGMDQFVQPQPDPKLVAEIEQLKAQAASLIEKSKLQAAEFEWQRKLDTANHELAKKEALLELVLRQREEERKDFETRTKAEVAHRELDIIESTPASETKQSNIVSPNS